MKVDLKRIFRAARKLIAAGAVAAMTLVGSASSSRAALVLSNGSFESPNLSGTQFGYAYYSVGLGWVSHNLGPDQNLGDHHTGNNGNLVQYAEADVTTGGMSTGSQYAAAVLWDTPANVFSATLGSAPTGMYVDQPIGTINPSDSAAAYSLSADLIRVVDAYYYNAGGQPSTVAGAGITIGFLNGNTGAVLAQTPISYTTGYAAGNATPVKITGSLTWSPSSSGLAVGTPVNAFVGFRLDPNYSNYLNSVAVDNLVLTSNLATLTWTGADGTNPTQWSTNPGLLNWSSSGNSSAYAEGSCVTFDDSVGFGSTVVDISAADVLPGSVVFSNSNASYTLQGSHGIAGAASLNVAGGGLLTINNSNSFTGGTTISGGTIQLGNPNGLVNSTVSVGVDLGLIFSPGNTAPTIGGLRGDGYISLSDGTNPVMLTVGGNNESTTYSGGMFDAGGLTKVGSGLLVLAEPNFYGGGTTIGGGTLQVGLGGSISLLGTGTVTNNGALAFSYTGNFIPAASAIGGSGSVVQQGTGIAGIGMPYVNLSSLPNGATSTPYHASYSAGNTGVVTADSAWAPVILPPASSGQPVGALFMVRGNSQYGLEVERTNTDLTGILGYGGYGTTTTFRWNGTVWNYLGVGLLGTNNQAAAANTYTGSTTVNGGTLALLTENGLSPATPVTIAAGATLDLGVGSQAVGSLSGNGNVSMLTFNLTIGGDDSKQTFGGVISGSGALFKTGTGAQTLSGTDTYTGGTNVNGGKLIFTNAAGILAGSNLYVGDPNLLSLFPAPVVPGLANDLPIAAQSADVQANGTTPPAPVPEPGTVALLATGAAVAAHRWRRRRRDEGSRKRRNDAAIAGRSRQRSG